MILFGLFAILGALGSRVLKLESVHNVVRKSLGTTLFAVVIVVLAYFFGENRMDLLRYGILILTIPDAATAVIGSIYGRQIPEFHKSILGSTVFFVGTFGLTLFFVENILHVLFITVVLTITEFFSQWGIDNLLMPVMGAWMVLLLV
jgi:dolichol kinase